ncbi:TonB family domain protein [Lysobacter enzymogenes]|uniref:TonB family domain protein n=1 Tax=Lysobacter enzymogenes TaxID=69 RepID=A0A0S2DNA3_LYSEN|nr:TonB family domain protein [Lysobacter enzymogenes]
MIEPARIVAAGQGPGARRRNGAWGWQDAAAGVALGLGLAILSGCGSGQPAASESAAAAPASAQDAADRAAPLPPALDELDAGGLRDRAARALREQRIHTPAGDSAVDYYLALREKAPGHADVAAALTELQPYVVIAGEQALADGDLAESRRLTDLLARMDPQAPALPRLREGLRSAQGEHERRAREDAERLAGERAEAATLARTQAAQRTAAANAALKAQANASAAAADEAAARASTPPAPVPHPAAAHPTGASAAAASAAPAPAAAAAATPAVPKPAAKIAPRLIADASPRYPSVAITRKLEGSVEVAFTIQPDGSTGAARVLSSQPAGVFDEAALSAVARLRSKAQRPEPSGPAHLELQAAAALSAGRAQRLAADRAIGRRTGGGPDHEPPAAPARAGPAPARRFGAAVGAVGASGHNAAHEQRHL